MMKRWGLLILLLLLGCGAERPLPATPPPTALPATATPTPTQTAVPTATASHTPTPLPTNTPLPTATDEPTATATPLPSSTPEPETAVVPTAVLDVPAVTRRSNVERWQGVAEYSFYSQSRQQEILFTLYVPPGYEQSDQRYPVLYFLHGSQGSHLLFWNAISREVAAANGNAGSWLSQLIQSGQLPPMIIVAPNDTDGGWGRQNEVMVTQELILAVDGNWRTIADGNGRSLAGFSLGAGGAMRYPAQYPTLYCDTMPLAESGDEGALAMWQPNQAAVLESGLEVTLVVGELDSRAVNASTAVQELLAELNIPHQLRIIPEVPHNFGQLYNEIGVWALQLHAACWEEHSN